MSLIQRNHKISIIIPVYKVERYLRECIDSILAQTYTDWELLLIDDGSPDSSGTICDEYAQLDSRIHAFHQPNGGASKARNYGIREAKGEYISFIDSDDYVASDYLETLVSMGDADIIMSGFTRVYPNHSIIEAPNFRLRCNTREEIIKSILRIDKARLLNSQCCKLIRKGIISDNNIFFDEGLSVSEDMLFCFECFSHCQTAICLNYSGYYYRQESAGSLSKTCFPFNVYTKSIESLLKYREYYIAENKDYKNFVEEEYIEGYEWALRSIKDMPWSTLVQIRKGIAQNTYLKECLLRHGLKNVEQWYIKNTPPILLYILKIKYIAIVYIGKLLR